MALAKIMNTPRTLLLALLTVSSLLVSLARADETAYANILKERDSILSQIVAHRNETKSPQYLYRGS